MRRNFGPQARAPPPLNWKCPRASHWSLAPRASRPDNSAIDTKSRKETLMRTKNGLPAEMGLLVDPHA